MPSNETIYPALRRFNLIMGFLHLVQGLFMWIVSNEFRSHPGSTSLDRSEIRAGGGGLFAPLGYCAFLSVKPNDNEHNLGARRTSFIYGCVAGIIPWIILTGTLAPV